MAKPPGVSSILSKKYDEDAGGYWYTGTKPGTSGGVGFQTWFEKGEGPPSVPAEPTMMPGDVSPFTVGGTQQGALAPGEQSAYGLQGAGGSTYQEYPFIQQQIANLASGDEGADIREQVQMDVLGPGYQAAEFGAAGAGVPGSGRVMRGREAVERKAAIQSAQMRRQNKLMQHQLINGYLDQAYKLNKLSSDEGIALAELLMQASTWAHDEHPDLARELPKIMAKAFKQGKNYIEVLTILSGEMAATTGMTV